MEELHTVRAKTTQIRSNNSFNAKVEVGKEKHDKREQQKKNQPTNKRSST